MAVAVTAARHRWLHRVGRAPVTSLARPRAVPPGEAATAKAAQGACQALEFGPFRARDRGPGRVDGTVAPVIRFTGPLSSTLTAPLAERPEAARGLDARVGAAVGAGFGSVTGVNATAGTAFGARTRPVSCVTAGALLSTSVETSVGTPVGTPVETLVELSVDAPAELLTALPVGRVGVGTDVVSLGPCVRTAGRIRFDRSGELKTSHGSRLFKGEGPTGEDNAARATGPPTG
ncbi:hypothetical protein ACFWIQ_23820 [Kitasatospora sp. NPDC127059]|uniref:hypothetical protein n=1 Tax=unclassified Kitasatospora TaxID=2633591 RepID=UPI00364AD8BE